MSPHWGDGLGPLCQRQTRCLPRLGLHLCPDRGKPLLGCVPGSQLTVPGLGGGKAGSAVRPGLPCGKQGCVQCLLHLPLLRQISIQHGLQVLGCRDLPLRRSCILRPDDLPPGGGDGSSVSGSLVLQLSHLLPQPLLQLGIQAGVK